MDIPPYDFLLQSDPVLRGHPAQWSWDTLWVIGIAVVRYVKVGGVVVRNSRGPVVEILVGKRGYATIESGDDVFRGPCDGYNPEGYWAIPTAFVEPTDANAIGTLARVLWMDLGFQVKEIVGCCSDITEVSVVDGKRFPKITYILTTDEVGEVTPPRWSEYEGLEWMQLDRFDGRRGVRLTSDGKEAVGKTIGFADVRLQTRTGPMRG
jgi:hypothetical protein